MNPDLVLIERDDPAITMLMLNRPEKRNALSLALIESLHRSILSASADPACRVLILRGNGPAFCAGLDLTEAAQPDGHERSAKALADLYEALGTSPLVTIAAAHGAAMGGGAGLLAACDFAVGTTNLHLGYPEVHRGLVAALVTCLLRRRLGDQAIRRLILLGQMLDGAEALMRGLIDQLATPDQLQPTAMDLARHSLKGAPGAIARTKQLLEHLAARSLRDDLNIALEFHLAARQSAEAAEGIAAFKEKRDPQWPPREV